jgi:hypothetical protein
MKYLLLLTLVAAGSCAVPVTSGGDIEELSHLLQGRFDNGELVSEDDPDGRMIDERIRIEVPSIGTHVFYQQITYRENMRIYRQRVLVLDVGAGDGIISQRAFALAKPDWYADAEAQKFADLTKDDLIPFMPPGCDQVWSKTDKGYRGYVDPVSCVIISSRTGKPRRIEAETIVTSDSLSLAERGFDLETGEQLFGSAEGEVMVLRRID